MTDNDQRCKAEAFRDMHRVPLLLLPNAWDALSARVFEDAGCRALAITSAGVSWSLGYPDGERVPWPEFVAAIARIAASVRVPVTADIEAGFGDTHVLGKHVRDVIQAGAVGINLEDSDPSGEALRTVESASAAISAARAAAECERLSLVINARIDVYLRRGTSEPAFGETLARAHAYREAGADCVYPIGLTDLGTIRKLTAELATPVNVMGRVGAPTLAELRAAGVARVSTATTAALYVAGALKTATQMLDATGAFDHFTSTYSYPDMQALFCRDG